MKVGKWFMVAVLAIPMAITSALTLQAQNSNIENSNVERWRSSAQTLPRNATVRVGISGGSCVRKSESGQQSRGREAHAIAGPLLTERQVESLSTSRHKCYSSSTRLSGR